MAENRGPDRSSTVDHALEILMLYMRKSAPTLTDIQNELGLSKTTAFRLLSTLVDRGFLLKERGGRYTLGVVVYQLAEKSRNLNLLTYARQHMREIANEFGETVYLGARNGYSWTIATAEEGSLPVRFFPTVGIKVPLYLGSTGKLILAYMTEAELKKYLKDLELVPRGPNSITSKDKLIEALKEIRKVGYSTAEMEASQDIAGVSCPIFGSNGELITALAVTMPVSRYTPERHLEAVQYGLNAAHDITNMLNSTHDDENR